MEKTNKNMDKTRIMGFCFGYKNNAPANAGALKF